MAKNETHVEVDAHLVRVSSPDKVVFPQQGWTKMDIVSHYLRVANGAVRGIYGRPSNLKRWPNGVEADPFYLRRTKPSSDIETQVVAFAAAHPGPMWIPRSAADIVRMVHLGCVDLNPWPSRAEDVDHPDELRLDLDPTPGVTFDVVKRVAKVVREILEEDGLIVWPKTSGSRGLHLYVRLAPRWTFHETRRAVLAVAREAERRTDEATTAWWKEERHGVFIDFNQTARDKTIASAYSVRPTGYVSTPFTWDELDDIDTRDFPMDRSGDRWDEAGGDPHAGIDDAPCDLTPTLRRVVRDEEEHGLGDAPWPPHYPKQPGEPLRVAPSRRADRDGT
ncbi:MAG: ATP-dependent DNA ligase [Actinobacteria bacterium]|nr:ATP-dependent DNA ligase [Actinomycetota bacterium]